MNINSYTWNIKVLDSITQICIADPSQSQQISDQQILPFSVWKSPKYLNRRSLLLARILITSSDLLGFATKTCSRVTAVQAMHCMAQWTTLRYLGPSPIEFTSSLFQTQALFFIFTESYIASSSHLPTWLHCATVWNKWSSDCPL